MSTLADAAVAPLSSVDLNNRRWLSQQQAAAYLGVTDRTIRNYVKLGSVRAHRLPGSRLIRYDRHELDAALRSVPSVKTGSGLDVDGPAARPSAEGGGH